MKKIAALFITALTLFAMSAAGCGSSAKVENTEPISQTDFKLDTVVTITLYDSQDHQLLADSINLCDKYEKIFSRTNESSELYQLNHRLLPPVEGTANTYEISESLAELLSLALSYSSDTDGAFDPAIAPLSQLWDFKSDSHHIPNSDTIQDALKIIGCDDVFLDGQQITLPSPDTAFDLGAIAKGYIADRIKEYLLSRDVHSAIISLGGNILCIGQKAGDTPFKIGIQKPFADRNETIAVMDITDKSVVSSGIYERFFEKNGTLYHHILNPKTGYPYENDLVSVTIISDSSAQGDALSTSCFALGLEKGMAYLSTQENVQAVFITNDYEIHYTPGFRDAISITEAS